MGRLVVTCNVFLSLFLLFCSVWLVGLYVTDPAIPYKVKLQHDVMRAVYYVSGVSEGSVFPFNRFLLSLRGKAAVDSSTSFDLSVPSLQPNRTKTEVPIRLYVPKTPKVKYRKVPVVVWMHGGGFVFGSVADQGNDKLARDLADSLGAYVVAVEYSLAPEHKFPDAIEDCYSVLYHLNKGEADWIKGINEFENFHPMSISTTFVGGAGAGGNLALHVKLLWQDRFGLNGSSKLQHSPYIPHHHFHQGILHILGEILLSPDLMEYPLSEQYHNTKYILRSDTNERMREFYLQDSVQLQEDQPFLPHQESLEAQRNNKYVSVMQQLGKEKLNIRPFMLSMKTGSLFQSQIKGFHDALTDMGILSEIHSLYEVPHGAAMILQSARDYFLNGAEKFLQSSIAHYYAQ